MRKTAVIFPGVGYTKDRPLLYYAGKLAAAFGYELIHVDFSGISWSKEKLKDRAFLEETMKVCLDKTRKKLDDLGDLTDADVIFISKSIGTVVATAYAKKMSVNAKQICFSPLEIIEEYVNDEGAVLFCADADRYADYASLERIATDKKLKIHTIKGGNHSLETGDVATDIDNLKQMMDLVKAYLEGGK